MQRILLVLILVLLMGLIGCAPKEPVVERQTWHVLTNVDRFTDTPVAMVTIGEYPSTTWVVTKSRHYYPFVGIREGELIFGIRAGGKIRIPVGAVQIRIDSNKAWDISPAETPVYLVPSQATIPMPVLAQTKEMQKNMEAYQENMSEFMAKSMSPFTAATGDKAKAIIREMFAGNRIIYRSVGFNAPSSTEGEVLIDESFSRAMSQIGITRDMLN